MMESIKATSLNSKVGSFLHLIPGMVSVLLDTPVSHVVVHGIRTSKSIVEIATELTTFNTGLPLTGHPDGALPTTLELANLPPQA